VFLNQKELLVIGMVHFSPLEGSDGYQSKEIVLERALFDLRLLLEGGVDVVFFENNFDVPKFASLPPTNAAHFEELVAALVPQTTVPWGLAPLWNDYRLGFRLCKKYGGQMVRVPVFVDSVETVYGIFEANPEQVLQARAEENASEVLILADVQVKHAKMLKPRPFVESVMEAKVKGADGVIVTGNWTGDPPSVEQCKEAYNAVHCQVAILTGSGMTPENLASFRPYLNGCIVGTAFKTDSVVIDRQGPNIVGPEVRYDLQKIKNFVQAAKKDSP